MACGAALAIVATGSFYAFVYLQDISRFLEELSRNGIFQWLSLGAAVGVAGLLLKSEKRPSAWRLLVHGFSGAIFGLLGGKFAAGLGAAESMQTAAVGVVANGGPRTLEGLLPGAQGKKEITPA